MAIRRRWAKRLLQGIGVRLEVRGMPPVEPGILIANHRSYLDPILMLQDVDAFPVAKAELANWPLIGKGAQMAGILYLKRDNIKSRAGALQQIHAVVNAGYPVIIFPEGTTSALPGVLPFKTGVFQLAAKNNLVIYPVALCFRSKADFWVGKETFLNHAGRRFKEKTVDVCLHYGPALQSDDPVQLLEMTRHWIENRLAESPAVSSS